MPAVADLLAAGELALASGDTEAAAAAFRRAAYLEPDHPLAHFQLGMALEALGQDLPARRAYLAARTALARADSEAVAHALQGYRIETLMRMLDEKVGGGR
jgi:Flp pilus assembly protein TadD